MRTSRAAGESSFFNGQVGIPYLPVFMPILHAA